MTISYIPSANLYVRPWRCLAELLKCMFFILNVYLIYFRYMICEHLYREKNELRLWGKHTILSSRNPHSSSDMYSGP